ncbi:unnamed protein product [Sphagnum compactum]
MIHCMVKRRMAPPAAGGHIKLSLESSSSSATGRTQEFATTTTHAAAAGTNNYSSTDRRRRNSYMVNPEAAAASSSSRAAGGSGTSEQQGGNLHESPKRDGCRVAEEEEEPPSSIGPAQRLCVGGGKKRLSPYRRVSDVREARRASLDNNSSHKFAYVSSLEGRLLMNSAQMASESGGGGLPPERETQQRAAASKKKEMDPLERVLIVAVSAAAAAAAGKYQKTEEFCRLRSAVDARERELEAMRQKLSNLCKQESGGNRECDPTLGDSILALAEREQEQQQCKNNNNRLSTQESSAVKEMAMEVDGSGCREEEEEEHEAAAAVVSDDSEAKWYCNPMLQTGEHYFEMCTPEYDDPLFPIRHHDKKEEQQDLQEQQQWQQHQWKGSKNGLLQRNLQKTAAGPQDGAAVETRKHQFAHHTNKKQSAFRTAVESDSSSAEVVAEQLLEELERAAGKVADMENQIKSLKQYAAESDANWKDSEVKLEEWIEGDYENQAKAHMEIQHLRRQLCTQESEYKSLERSCKVMLAVKSKEITELREDCQRRDTALDDITAAARATRAASDERIGVLEDLCRRKDSVIFDLKQDILALESKINGMRTFQAPAMLHHAARPHSCMCLPPPQQSDELIVANMSLPETNSTTRRFPYYLPPPVQSAAQGQQSSFSVEPQKDCLSEGNDCRGGACSSSSMLQLCEDYTSVDKPLHAAAYRIDQESAKDFYSPTPSTIGDDFHELESSLLALSVDEERKTRGSTSSGRSRNLPTPPPLDDYHVVEESNFNHNLPRQKKKSPAMTFTNTSMMGQMQVNAGASTIVNNESMRTSCSSSNTVAGKLSSFSGKKKVAVKRESFCSPRTSVEILGSGRTNSCYDPRRAVSVDLTNGGFKSLARNGLKENSIKQRRWV